LNNLDTENLRIRSMLVGESFGGKEDMSVQQHVALLTNTFTTPNSGTTTASRQTVFTGEATRRAYIKLREALEKNDIKNLNG